MKRVNAKIYGIVQGVGFRNFVRTHAKKLGVTGWIKNNLDGSVETVLEGSKEAIEDLLERCKKGTFLAWVEKVEVREEEPKNDFDDFIILR